MYINLNIGESGTTPIQTRFTAITKNNSFFGGMVKEDSQRSTSEHVYFPQFQLNSQTKGTPDHVSNMSFSDSYGKSTNVTRVATTADNQNSSVQPPIFGIKDSYEHFEATFGKTCGILKLI